MSRITPSLCWRAYARRSDDEQRAESSADPVRIRRGGSERVEGPQVVGEVSRDELEKLVWDQLRTCYDPEIPVNIVDLGLVYQCELTDEESGGHKVRIKMTLTAPGCGMGPVLANDVLSKIVTLPGVTDADVDVVFDPVWDRSMMSEAAKLQLGVW